MFCCLADRSNADLMKQERRKKEVLTESLKLAFLKYLGGADAEAALERLVADAGNPAETDEDEASDSGNVGATLPDGN